MLLTAHSNLYMSGSRIPEMALLLRCTACQTHRRFLQQQYEGILQLTIHGAKDLKAVNASLCNAPCRCCRLPYCSRGMSRIEPSLP